MNLTLNPDQRDFQATVRDLVTKGSSLEQLRATSANRSGFDPALWQRFVESGAPGILIPEDLGGLGLGLTEASVVLEELGRGLAPLPFLSSSVIGVTAIQAMENTSFSSELLPRIASGESLVAFASAETTDTWIPTEIKTTATKTNGQWRITGSKNLVLDGQFADVLIVLAAAGDDPALFVVDSPADGLTVQPLQLLDRSRNAARLDLDRVAGRKLDTADTAEVLRRIDGVASAALASEQYGAYLRELEIATQYAKDRVQFGRSIGSFQGIKHPLAEMAMEAELAYSLLRHATWSADNAPEDEFRVAALTAQVKLQGIAFDGAARMITTLGGIGYTWEHDAHLFMKHAKTTQLLLGTPSKRVQQLATALGV